MTAFAEALHSLFTRLLCRISSFYSRWKWRLLISHQSEGLTLNKAYSYTPANTLFNTYLDIMTKVFAFECCMKTHIWLNVFTCSDHSVCFPGVGMHVPPPATAAVQPAQQASAAQAAAQPAQTSSTMQPQATPQHQQLFMKQQQASALLSPQSNQQVGVTGERESNHVMLWGTTIRFSVLLQFPPRQ